MDRTSFNAQPVTAGTRLPGRASGEAGYILIGVLILLALFVIGLAVAAPIVAKDLERDKEVETVQRGKQYIRAIKLYYKRFGAYPTSISQLENTNNIRYLRKRYVDPMTGKDDWRIIHVGEAKVPVMGFFGQPLQATSGSATTGLAGNGTGGTLGTPIGSSGSSDPGGTTPAAPIGVLPGMSGGGAGGIGGGGATPGGGIGSPSGGSGLGQTGTSPTGTSPTGSTTGSDGFSGGGPIVGVGIPVEKKSLVVYHKQDTFKKWEFTYDPLQDQMMLSSSSIPGATPAGGAAPGSPLTPTTPSPTAPPAPGATPVTQ